jgi:hypothetical protein
MTTYTAYFHTDADYASHDFESETPEEALALARKLYADELHTDVPSKLRFEPYIDMTVNEITIHDADYNKLAVWYDDHMRLRLAARDLLEAAELVVARWERGDLAEAVRELSAAIAKAKGGAA